MVMTVTLLQTVTDSWRPLFMGGALVMTGISCGTTSAIESAPLSNSSRPPTSENMTIGAGAPMTSTTSTLSADLRDVVAVSFDALMERRIECGRRPRACDVGALAAADSPLFERLTALMEQRVQASISASRRGSVRYRIDDVEITTGDQALVTTCLTDDTVLMSAGAIFNDSRYSAITHWVMKRSDRGWLWFEDHVVDWRQGEDLCAFDE